MLKFVSLKTSRIYQTSRSLDHIIDRSAEEEEEASSIDNIDGHHSDDHSRGRGGCRSITSLRSARRSLSLDDIRDNTWDEGDNEDDGGLISNRENRIADESHIIDDTDNDDVLYTNTTNTPTTDADVGQIGITDDFANRFYSYLQIDDISNDRQLDFNNISSSSGYGGWKGSRNSSPDALKLDAQDFEKYNTIHAGSMSLHQFNTLKQMVSLFKPRTKDSLKLSQIDYRVSSINDVSFAGWWVCLIITL